MKITVVGAGPAGLYFALLMKKQSPAHAITLLERDGPNDTFGWGIVFSQRTVEVLKDSDPDTCAEITRRAETWDDVAVVHKGERITVGGNRFYG
ncbi:MAG: NAD(P)-binding protein, partial [candidate division NC10 bacterium]